MMDQNNPPEDAPDAPRPAIPLQADADPAAHDVDDEGTRASDAAPRADEENDASHAGAAKADGAPFPLAPERALAAFDAETAADAEDALDAEAVGGTESAREAEAALGAEATGGRESTRDVDAASDADGTLGIEAASNTESTYDPDAMRNAETRMAEPLEAADAPEFSAAGEQDAFSATAEESLASLTAADDASSIAADTGHDATSRSVSEQGETRTTDIDDPTSAAAGDTPFEASPESAPAKPAKAERGKGRARKGATKAKPPLEAAAEAVPDDGSDGDAVPASSDVFEAWDDSAPGAVPAPAAENRVALDAEGEGPEGISLGFDETLTLEGQVEAIVFASPKPVRAQEIAEILLNQTETSVPVSHIEAVLRQLHKSYRERHGGFHLEFVKGAGYQFQTVPAAAPLMETLFSQRPRPLSRAALETLAIIAYRQPVTRAEVEYIRGVDAGSIIKNLLERNLVACVGRKEDAGRPMVFGTTDEFLKVFRIQAVSELPPLSSFQPPPELMAEADALIRAQNETIDVEPFIGDAEKGESEFSAGLLADDETVNGDGENAPLAAEGMAIDEAASVTHEGAAPDESSAVFAGSAVTDDAATDLPDAPDEAGEFAASAPDASADPANGEAPSLDATTAASDAARPWEASVLQDDVDAGLGSATTGVLDALGADEDAPASPSAAPEASAPVDESAAPSFASPDDAPENLSGAAPTPEDSPHGERESQDPEMDRPAWRGLAPGSGTDDRGGEGEG